MLKNKKILIILISIFLALVIGVSTVLIIAVSVPSDKSEDTNQAETDNTTSVQEFSIEINGTKYLSGTTNDIDLVFGELNTFSINGVESYNDYDFKIVPFLPSSNYYYYFNVSSDALLRTGNERFISGTGVKIQLLSIAANIDYSRGFSQIVENNSLSIMLGFSDINSFLDNYFGEDVTRVPYTPSTVGSIELYSLKDISIFKLNIRKTKTDELISFLLCFK